VFTVKPKHAIVVFAVLVLSLYWFGRSNTDSVRVVDEATKRAEEAEAAAKEKARVDELRAKMPENYAKGVELLKSRNYSQAVSTLQEVSKIDSTYMDVVTNLQKAKTGMAGQLISEANALSKSDKCGQMDAAANKFQEAIRIDSTREQAVATSLQRVQEKKLSCFEGSAELEMAIQINKRRPVTLYVWIKNKSNGVRHANPNYFTLITATRESHSYSSDSFEYSKPFGAVQLQPGTEASGIVVFDTYDTPKTLIYQETLGGRVSREFP